MFFSVKDIPQLHNTALYREIKNEGKTIITVAVLLRCGMLYFDS